MSIELKITDPELHGVLELRAIASFFTQLADDKFGAQTVNVAIAGSSEAAICTIKRAADGTFDKEYSHPGQQHLNSVGTVADPIDPATVVSDTEASTTAADHVVVAETDAERIQRLHGNVASAGGDTDGPLTAAKVFGGEAPKPSTETAVAPVAPQAPSPDAPVAPTAPAPTAPAAPAPSSGIAIDKAGLPHDKRIHSTPPSINKGDGLWRAKRGRDEIEAKRIEAELLQLMAVPAPTAPAAPVADAPKPDPDPSATAAPAPVAPQAPTAPVAPTASAPASTTPKNLGELMTWAQGQVAAGNIASLDAVRAAAVEAGVAALPLLGTRPDLVPVVYAKLGGV